MSGLPVKNSDHELRAGRTLGEQDDTTAQRTRIEPSNGSKGGLELGVADRSREPQRD